MIVIILLPEANYKQLRRLPESMPPVIPEKDGSSPKISINFTVAPFSESGCLPPPVFFLATAHLLCSFFATLTIPRHFSFTSRVLLLQTLSAFTFSVISSHALFLFLFVRFEENLLLIISRCCSAASKSTVHSAAVKFGFHARFVGEGSTFSAILLVFREQHASS